MATSEANLMKRDALARAALAEGAVLPAHPLALDSSQRLDERCQRALTRYYVAAGAGGVAVGVHTTQFQIHDPQVGLLQPVFELTREELDRADVGRALPLIRVAGIYGDLRQAVAEAAMASELGYQFGLLNLGALRGASIDQLLDHVCAVAEFLGVFGFYLQPSVGGVDLPFEFWKGFCEIENGAATKVAAFDRYRTIDVVRAVAESGRDDIALYTGNDDNILFDLLAQHRFMVHGRPVTRRFVGGLLGQWAVWTSAAAALHRQCLALSRLR